MRSAPLLHLPASLLLSVVANAQHACLFNQLPTYGVVHQQPLSISTEIMSNTTFQPFPGVDITVTNAPTIIQGVTTVSWTEKKTDSLTRHTRAGSTVDGYMGTQSSAHAVPTSAGNTFIMMVTGGLSSKVERRQSGSKFVSVSGTVTNDCSTIPVYTIVNGTLTAQMNGTTYYYSTSPGVAYEPFIPTTIPGSITTAFQLTDGTGLAWLNPAFYDGQAQFCATVDGTIYVVFQLSAIPSGCLIIELSLFAFSSCQNIQLITGPSGPSGPVGATGSQGIQGPTDMYLNAAQSVSSLTWKHGRQMSSSQSHSIGS